MLPTWKVSLTLGDFLSSSLFPLSSKLFLSNKIQFFRANVKVSNQRVSIRLCKTPHNSSVQKPRPEDWSVQCKLCWHAPLPKKRTGRERIIHIKICTCKYYFLNVGKVIMSALHSSKYFFSRGKHVPWFLSVGIEGKRSRNKYLFLHWCICFLEDVI